MTLATEDPKTRPDAEEPIEEEEEDDDGDIEYDEEDELTEVGRQKKAPRGTFRGFFVSMLTLFTSRSFPLNEYTWYEHTLLMVRRTKIMKMLARKGEEEDVLSLMYVRTIREMERTGPGPYRTDKPVPLNQTLMGNAETQHPLCGETRDLYQILTWKWLKKRLEIEESDIRKGSVAATYIAVLQIMLSIALVVLGTLEFHSVKYVFVIMSIVIGVFGMISGLVRIFTSSEVNTRRFLSLQLWLLCLLSTYLHTAAEEVLGNNKVCTPSESDLSSSGTACSDVQSVLIASLIICCVGLVSTFFTIFLTLDMLDGQSDRESIENEILMFKFFQRKIDEMELQLGMNKQ
eukprot:TRINITY_DN15954_c0_g1_i1.p1 TRINITY_DN15954_c0_g1~~TRINITY_DN15954_c0_g1_i1.p1  ORF type:complete len:358 (+),score=51.43 TRINITY_DN15954_c0_g1_i1:38-1075(+)